MIEGRCHCGNISFTLTWDARCGVVPVVTSRIDGRLYAVVSVNAFEGMAPARLKRTPANFDGEGTDSRLERRKRNWIPDVEFTA